MKAAKSKQIVPPMGEKEKNKTTVPTGAALAAGVVWVDANHPENVLVAGESMTPAEAEAKADFDALRRADPGMVRRFLDSDLGRTFRRKGAASG